MVDYTKPEDEEEAAWNNRVVSLKRFEIDPYYYLPSWTEHRESFADFSRITHLASSYLSDLFTADKRRRSISLSSKGHLLLLSKLAYFFVRLESVEIARVTEH